VSVEQPELTPEHKTRFRIPPWLRDARAVGCRLQASRTVFSHDAILMISAGNQTMDEIRLVSLRGEAPVLQLHLEIRDLILGCNLGELHVLERPDGHQRL
jgi:hypothetical protein